MERRKWSGISDLTVLAVLSMFLFPFGLGVACGYLRGWNAAMSEVARVNKSSELPDSHGGYEHKGREAESE